MQWDGQRRRSSGKVWNYPCKEGINAKRFFSTCNTGFSGYENSNSWINIFIFDKQVTGGGLCVKLILTTITVWEIGPLIVHSANQSKELFCILGYTLIVNILETLIGTENYIGSAT